MSFYSPIVLNSEIYFNNKKIITGILSFIHSSKNAKIIKNLSYVGKKIINVSEIFLKVLKV